MKFRTTGTLVLSAAAMMLALAATSVSAGVAQPRVVSANPATMPQIPIGDYAVLGLQQVGSTLYAGGRFNSLGGRSRTNIGAFSATTGAMTNFAPSFNAQVWAIENLGGGRLAVGGEFSSVNGVARRGLAVVNATTGAVDTSFNAHLTGNVTTLKYRERPPHRWRQVRQATDRAEPDYRGRHRLPQPRHRRKPGVPDGRLPGWHPSGRSGRDLERERPGAPPGVHGRPRARPRARSRRGTTSP